MLYLFLATVCSASIAIIFKYSEIYKCDKYIVTLFNYLTASIISFIMIINTKLSVFIAVSNPIQALLGNLNGNITAQGSYIFSLILGIITGVLYLVGFLLYQMSIKNCGASLSGMFSKMGIIIPMLISIIIWREYPSAVKWIGIILMISSIVIVNINIGSNSKSHFRWSLLLMLIVTGFSDLSNKLIQKYAFAEYKSHLLFFIFITALIICAGLCIKNSSSKFNFKSALFGVLIGVPNILTTFFIIEALMGIQATIVYPAFSAGTIVLIMLLSFILFKEKLRKQELIAIFITLIGIILVNS